MRSSRIAVLLVLAACGGKSSGGTSKPAPAKPAQPVVSAADAKAFIDRLNADMTRLVTEWQLADWEYSTNINDANEAASAAKQGEVLTYLGKAIKEARKYKNAALDPAAKRQLHLLTISSPIAPPDDAAKREELTQIATKMPGHYGKAKYCKTEKNCRDLGQLEDVLADSRKYDDLLDAWRGWHDTADPQRALYVRFVELANEGARDIGFKDTGELWRSAYDMSPAELTAETERLWQQTKPLYDKLHCYVRGRLAKKYGNDKVQAGKPIPAHLLGNMWAQEWANIYPLVEPYKGQASIDVTAGMKKKKVTELQMVKVGEGFFTSLGLDPLPATFWERSLFLKPKDREVVCHASAWNVNLLNDLRIKMCIKVTQEDLVTIHHELGHNYYEMYYAPVQPHFFKAGAHDGFHEAIGDAIALSVTPEYLQKQGYLGKVAKNPKALINLQMKDALEKVAFLPFGLLIDKWRWEVFAGTIKPDQYNAAWWQLRQQYQGIAPAVARGEEHFDAGAKYHIPGNTPYLRYFLARILQFQFHKSLCEAAGHQGPLHECSIYGSKEAGAKLKALLEMGQSRPWPDALEALTGSRQMDAGPLLEYFAPLSAWLDEQNAGQQCGW